MKYLFRPLMLTILLIGWGIPACLMFYPTKETPYQTSLTVPLAALDLSDLDVRDNLNRSVNSADKIRMLQNLFVDQLNNLLANNLTPYARFMRDMMNNSWDVFSSWLRNAVDSARISAQSWWQKRKSHFAALSVTSVLPLYIGAGSLQGSVERRGFDSLVSSIISSTVLLR